MILLPQIPAPDSLRAVLNRVFEAPEYDWETPRHPLDWLTELRDRLQAWLADLQGAHPVAFAIFVIALTVLLILILVHMGYLAWRALHPEPAPSAGAPAASPEARDARWHLAQSRGLAEEGRYSEALAHRFVALLLQMDAGSVLTFHPSKTPGEYLREARLAESDRQVFSGLISALYRHLFGGVACDLACLTDFDRDAAALGRVHASA